MRIIDLRVFKFLKMKKKINHFTQNFDIISFETYQSTNDPTENNDASKGVAISDEWINTATGAIFKCTDATTGSAVWFNFVNAANNDKNLVVPFSNKTGIVINHNFGKYPSVTVMDTSNEEIEAEVIFNNLNRCTINLNTAISGTIILN